nr:sodium-dependent nutrient amino acid transporter 1-like isoform X2 [Nomia melanderi]
MREHGRENAAFVGDDGLAASNFQKRDENGVTRKVHGNKDTFNFQYGEYDCGQDDRKSPVSLSVPEEMTIAENGKERATWNNGVEFLMSCIAMSIGLGNVWRFPFTAYENGGGVFLIPYIIVLFIVGKPFYYLEMIMGQFCSRSSVKMWAAVPGFRGVGWAQMFSMLAVGTYYCSLMSVTLFYLFASFQSILPWSTCLEQWGDNCVDSGKSENATKRNGTSMVSSAELYFRRIVLKEKQSIDDGIGAPDWKLTVCLLISWLCIFGVLARGVKTSGKAAYFLAIFPYVVMISLLVRAVTLEGAVNGIIFFIKPDWSKLFDANVWDVIVVTTLDTFTSLMAGFTIFGILGNLAHELGTEDIGNVVRGGTGLAFVSYPDAIAKFNVLPQLFSVLFFLMLYVLGIGSAIAIAGAVITIISDQFPHWKYFYIVAGTVSGGFLAGTIYCTPGGQFILELVDYYGGSFIIFILATLEITGIFWVYGLENFVDDVEYMLRRRPSMYWRLCWAVITPVLLAVILVYTLVTLTPVTYSGISYPKSAHAAGWTLCVFGALQVPFWFIYTVMSNKGSKLVERIGSAFSPSSDWGPKNAAELASWREFKETKRKIREKRECSRFKQFIYVALCMEDKLA